MTTEPLGCSGDHHGLTERQIQALLLPIEGERVRRVDGQSHVAVHDVIARANAIFGFTGWSKEVLALDCVRDTQRTVRRNDEDKVVPAVTYRALVRVTIKCLHGVDLTCREDVGTGTSPNLPNYGDAHDFAAKNAVSYGVKRCLKDLGDQFGLSLYERGMIEPIVRDTLALPRGGIQPAVKIESLGDEPEPHIEEGHDPTSTPVTEDTPPTPVAPDHVEPTSLPEVTVQEWPGQGMAANAAAKVARLIATAENPQEVDYAVAIARRSGGNVEQGRRIVQQAEDRKATLSAVPADRPPGAPWPEGVAEAPSPKPAATTP